MPAMPVNAGLAGGKSPPELAGAGGLPIRGGGGCEVVLVMMGGRFGAGEGVLPGMMSAGGEVGFMNGELL